MVLQRSPNKFPVGQKAIVRCIVSASYTLFAEGARMALRLLWLEADWGDLLCLLVHGGDCLL